MEEIYSALFTAVTLAITELEFLMRRLHNEIERTIQFVKQKHVFKVFNQEHTNGCFKL